MLSVMRCHDHGALLQFSPSRMEITPSPTAIFSKSTENRPSQFQQLPVPAVEVSQSGRPSTDSAFRATPVMSVRVAPDPHQQVVASPLVS